MTWRLDHPSTVLLIHGDGVAGSTAFIDEAGHAITANGNAQIDTAESKFGGGSILLDGTGDFLSLNDSPDWRLDDGSNSNLWMVDFWVRFNGDPGTGVQGLFQQYTDTGNFFGLVLSNNALVFQMRSGGATLINLSFAWNPAGDIWYHTAYVKNGTAGYMAFVDGTQVGATQTDTDPLPDLASAMTIGRYITATPTTTYLNGRMEEVRIRKAKGILTASFTPPSRAYWPARTIAAIAR